MKRSIGLVPRRRWALAALPLVSVIALAGAFSSPPSTAATTPPARTFVERFTYAGPEAFTTPQGGHAVWWNQNNWDARNDTHYIAVSHDPGMSESDPYQGHFTAIQKAANARDLTTSGVLPGAGKVGGDGSAGVGVMRIDYQGIASARLRNPMLISAARPGVVTFWAPLFATTGHWWEVSIMPTAQPYGAEYSAVPGRQSPESLNNPVNGSPGIGSTNGPGHRSNVQNAINVISTGWPDAPTCNGQKWSVRWAVTKAMAGKVTDFVNPRGSNEKLQTVSPAQRTQLRKWQIVYSPTGIKLYSALNATTQLKLVDQWKATVPWKEVYVNLMYVAYQAGHHPQAGCGLHTYGITQAQQMGWRDVSVYPVKYRATYALPQPTTTVNVARRDGWMNFDLRDINYHRGSGQPNADFYDEWQSYLYCSQDTGGGLPCPRGPTNPVTLRVNITSAQLKGLARAQLLADVRHPGSANVTVNGRPSGVLRGQAVRPDLTYSYENSEAYVDEFDANAWIRHSLNLPLDVLHVGWNTIQLTLTPDTDIDLDRIQLELSNN